MEMLGTVASKLSTKGLSSHVCGQVVHSDELLLRNDASHI